MFKGIKKIIVTLQENFEEALLEEIFGFEDGPLDVKAQAKQDLGDQPSDLASAASTEYMFE